MKEQYNPYCKSCEGCGEDGCCSYINCAISSIRKNKKCDYPETYIDHLLFDKTLLDLLSRADLIPSDIYDQAYDTIFKNRK